MFAFLYKSSQRQYPPGLNPPSTKDWRILYWEDFVLGGFYTGRILYWEDFVLLGFGTERILYWEEIVLGGYCTVRILYWEGFVLEGFILGRFCTGRILCIYFFCRIFYWLAI